MNLINSSNQKYQLEKVEISIGALYLFRKDLVNYYSESPSLHAGKYTISEETYL